MSKIIKLLFIGLFITILINQNSSVFAFQNEPNGFRGIVWGSSKDSIPNLECDTKSACSKRNDKMSVGGANLTYIYYFFYKNQFESVALKTDNYTDSRALLRALESNFGRGYKPNHYIEKYYWNGDDTLMIYDENSIDYSASVFMYSKEITALKDKEEQNAAAQSKNDF